MKNILLLTITMLLAITGFAGNNNTTKAKAKAASGFWHHCGEFHVTPSADYFIYSKGSNFQKSEPYEFRMPFIGFDMGAQYMYRPIEMFGVSAGLGFRMQGFFNRVTTTPIFGEKYVSSRSYGHVGFLQVPIELHLFKKMPKSTFEFATGPQFNFPVFANNYTSLYMPNGDKIGETVKTEVKYDTDAIRDNATLGWNILLGAEFHLCNHTDLFVGPQINFLNIASFRKDVNEARRNLGFDLDCSLGLKLGFRFHCEE